MKIFLDKISIGPGQRKFKLKVQKEDLTTGAVGFDEVSVMTNRNLEDLGVDSSELYQYNNNTLYDIDSVNTSYFSGDNEDSSFRLPLIRQKDFVQFNEFDFTLTNEPSGTLALPLDKFALFDRYQDIPNSVIKYNDARFGDVNITSGMSDDEIYAELEKVFGDANELGSDHPTIDPAFIGEEYVKINSGISIARQETTLPYSYVMESDLTEAQNIGDNGFVSVNPFKTKNHLKNDYNVYIDADEFVAWRRYNRIGRISDNLWLSYKVDQSDNSTNEYLTRDFETVEHIEGVSKYKGESDGHKSSIYSIRIHNSGLNQTGEIYTELRNIFEKSLFNLMTKIAPVHTQLWKIEYVDQ